MDAENQVEQPVLLSKQPLFIGCNEEVIVNIIIDKVNDHNKLVPDGKPQIEVAVMSQSLFLTSYHQWREKQPEVIESMVGKDVLSDDMLTARGHAYNALLAMGLLNVEFNIASYKKAFKNKAKKVIPSPQALTNIHQMQSTGVIACINAEEQDGQKRNYRFILTQEEIKNIYQNNIKLKIAEINKLQREVGGLSDMILNMEEKPVETGEELETASDHINDK